MKRGDIVYILLASGLHESLGHPEFVVQQCRVLKSGLKYGSESEVAMLHPNQGIRNFSRNLLSPTVQGAIAARRAAYVTTTKLERLARWMATQTFPSGDDDAMEVTE